MIAKTFDAAREREILVNALGRRQTTAQENRWTERLARLAAELGSDRRELEAAIRDEARA